jgi:hypothetical protein
MRGINKSNFFYLSRVIIVSWRTGIHLEIKTQQVSWRSQYWSQIKSDALGLKFESHSSTLGFKVNVCPFMTQNGVLGSGEGMNSCE